MEHGETMINAKMDGKIGVEKAPQIQIPKHKSLRMMRTINGMTQMEMGRMIPGVGPGGETRAIRGHGNNMRMRSGPETSRNSCPRLRPRMVSSTRCNAGSK